MVRTIQTTEPAPVSAGSDSGLIKKVKASLARAKQRDAQPTANKRRKKILRAIKDQMQRTKPSIPFTKFDALAREIGGEVTLTPETPLRWSKLAVVMVAAATEKMLADVFRASNAEATANARPTVMVRDMLHSRLVTQLYSGNDGRIDEDLHEHWQSLQDKMELQRLKRVHKAKLAAAKVARAAAKATDV